MTLLFGQNTTKLSKIVNELRIIITLLFQRDCYFFLLCSLLLLFFVCGLTRLRFCNVFFRGRLVISVSDQLLLETLGVTMTFGLQLSNRGKTEKKVFTFYPVFIFNPKLIKLSLDLIDDFGRIEALDETCQNSLYELLTPTRVKPQLFCGVYSNAYSDGFAQRFLCAVRRIRKFFPYKTG